MKEGSTEKWKQVKDYDDYFVSNLGRVKSFKRSCLSRMLEPHELSIGYLQVDLCRSKSDHKKASVHKLVATAFLPNPDNLPQVNHLDGDKTNNLLSNLEWCTAQHNSEHATAKSYRFFSPEGRVVEVFNLNRFCRENGLDTGNMWKVFNGLASHCHNWRRCGQET